MGLGGIGRDESLLEQLILASNDVFEEGSTADDQTAFLNSPCPGSCYQYDEECLISKEYEEVLSVSCQGEYSN